MVKVCSKVIDITPLRPCYTGGYAIRDKMFEGVNDPLEAVVMWLQVDESKLLFINADIINFYYGFADKFRDELSKTFGVVRDQIVLSATHNHNGPMFDDDRPFPIDEEYEKLLHDRLLAAAADIKDSLQDVASVKATAGESVGYYGNRNGKKPGDQKITVIEFKDKDGKNISVMINISTHSTVVGPNHLKLTADLHGNVRRKVASFFGVTPMMMQGNSGDMSNRLQRQGNDYAELDRVTSGIAQQIMAFDYDHGTYLNLSHVQTHSFSYAVSNPVDKEGLTKKVAAWKEKVKTTTNFDDLKLLKCEIISYERDLKHDSLDFSINGTVIRMGDLELVCLPCELVAAFGMYIKSVSTAKCCILWGYCNGRTTYVIEASEYGAGHSGNATKLVKGQAEEFVGKVIQNLF